ncbi:hypothetical protein M6B38_353275 [Iris pallida]|uniref:Uncharacterized protein n=1 Tax=Iris pallida TaxID=29817 RepID=A0AAX6GQ24_IRIPA|nr:hypothetical protein M6B38_353275 [Iris pallida]
MRITRVSKRTQRDVSNHLIVSANLSLRCTCRILFYLMGQSPGS